MSMAQIYEDSLEMGEEYGMVVRPYKDNIIICL
jgi:hypothetical protein